MAINITNEKLWGEIVSEELVAIDTNLKLTSFEKVRYTNALAKAAARIEDDANFIHFDRETGNLLILSNFEFIYKIDANGSCQCRAAVNGKVCWHRAARRLVSRYLVAEAIEKCAVSAL